MQFTATKPLDRALLISTTEAKVLFYWNAFLDIRSYQASREFPVGGRLEDQRGRPVMVRETVATFDLSRADMHEWWTDVAAKTVRGGWTFRRKFEHASVFVDVERKTAKVDWK